jgi:hypothetical protein
MGVWVGMGVGSVSVRVLLGRRCGSAGSGGRSRGGWMRRSGPTTLLCCRVVHVHGEPVSGSRHEMAVLLRGGVVVLVVVLHQLVLVHVRVVVRSRVVASATLVRMGRGYPLVRRRVGRLVASCGQGSRIPRLQRRRLRRGRI